MRGQDPARHIQALHRGELVEWQLTVRRHHRGHKVLVYGTVKPDWRNQREEWAGGQLLDSGGAGEVPWSEIAWAMGEVAREADMPAHVAREPISDPPLRGAR